MNDWDEVWRPYAFDKNDKDLAQQTIGNHLKIIKTQ